MKKLCYVIIVAFLASLLVAPGICTAKKHKKPRIFAKGDRGYMKWVLMEKGAIVTMERIAGAGVSSTVYVACMTQDGSNKGHVYKNVAGLKVWDSGGHVDKKTFIDNYKMSHSLVAGHCEFRFQAIGKGWTLLCYSVNARVKPVVSFGLQEGDVAIVVDIKQNNKTNTFTVPLEWIKKKL